MIYYGTRDNLWPDRVSTWEKHKILFSDFTGGQEVITLSQTAVIHGIKVKPTVAWNGSASIEIPNLMTAYNLSAATPAADEYKTSLTYYIANSVTLNLTGTPTVGELDLYLDVSYPE